MFKFQNIILRINNFRQKHPRTYFFIWFFLGFALLFTFCHELSGYIFGGLLISVLILKVPDRPLKILALLLLSLCPLVLILQDKALAELTAVYAYIFLFAAIINQFKSFRQDHRLNLKIFNHLNWQKINLIFLALLTLIIFQEVLTKKGQIEIGDLSFPISAERVLGNPFFLWNEYGSSPETLSTNIAPLVFLNAGWNYILHLPAEVISRLIILEFILAGLFSTYFLGHKIFKHFTAEPLYLELSCTIMTIFYLFNPYALQRIVHLYHWIAYNLLPLILLLGLYFWETKKWRFPVLIALLLSFISFSPHYLVYTIYALLLWAILEIIYHFLHPVRVHKSLQQKIKLVLKALSLFLIFGFCFLTFSAYWLIPYLKLAFIENAPAAPGYFLTKEYFEVSQEKAKVIIETLALSPDRPQSKILNIFFWVFISFLPLLLFLPLLKRWRNKYTIFFSILGITAAIFSTMPIWGLGLYLKTLFDIPYLNQFGWLLRENIRVNGLLAFSYSFLLAFFTLMALKKAYPFPFTKKKSLT